MNKMF
jgi:hypothetical protein